MLNKNLLNKGMKLLEKAEGHYVSINIWGSVSTVLLFKSLEAMKLINSNREDFIRLMDNEDENEFSFDIMAEEIEELKYSSDEEFTIHLCNNLHLNFSVE